MANVPATPATTATRGANTLRDAAPLAVPVELGEALEPECEPEAEPDAECEPDAEAPDDAEAAAGRVEVTTAEVAATEAVAVPSSTVMYVPCDIPSVLSPRLC